MEGKLIITKGDIVSDELLAAADAVVNSTNPMMICGSGVCGAIFKKAGSERLEEYTLKTFDISLKNKKNWMTAGEVRVTPGFSIPCDIIFAQAPKRWECGSHEEAFNTLLRTYGNIFACAVDRGYKRILLPALATKRYGFTHADTAEKVVATLIMLSNKYGITATLVLSDEEALQIYLAAQSAYLQRLNK